ncbi:TIGR02234 family membrane protein [Streptomyces sp. BI20]|uniref:TIGR02234 family membrane protein n=1 Tax=Streptomyces sp. BI20 TaxID=3403460 RepID=UPI003C722A4A
MAEPGGRVAVAQRAGRRSAGLALLLGALGATVVLLASGRVWTKGTAAVADSTLTVTADGRAVTGVPAALAIVALAALVALFAVRGKARPLVAALLTMCGLGGASAAAFGAGDREALDEAAVRTTAESGAQAASLTHTPWPWVTAVGAVLILLAGVIALRSGANWPGMGGRYERGGAAPHPRGRRAPDAEERPEDLWKALDRGEDPTR